MNKYFWTPLSFNVKFSGTTEEWKVFYESIDKYLSKVGEPITSSDIYKKMGILKALRFGLAYSNDLDASGLTEQIKALTDLIDYYREKAIQTLGISADLLGSSAPRFHVDDDCVIGTATLKKEEVKSKYNWEIQSFRDTKSKEKWHINKSKKYTLHPSEPNIGYSLNSMFHVSRCVDSEDFEIYSVKRLSDDYVFTVGDENTGKKQSTGRGTIEGINISNVNDGIYLNIKGRKDNGDWQYIGCPIEELELKTPLFASADNVPIYEGHKGYYVRKDWSIGYLKSGVESRWGLPNKYFDKLENAQDYIIENAPTLPGNWNQISYLLDPHDKGLLKLKLKENLTVS